MVGTQYLLTVGLCPLELVAAHPQPEPQSDTLPERSAKAERCANEFEAVKRKRHAICKREVNMNKRGLRLDIDDVDTIYTIHAAAPHFDFITNESCILTPEITQRPSQLIAQNMAQDQVGVSLELDIGVIDNHSCEPIEGVLVSLWHCNATGSYSSYTGRDPNTPFETLLEQEEIDDPSNYSDFRFLHTDSTTWLRSMWPTDVHGVTTFSTIFPGSYVERTIHILAQVYTNWNVTTNGTIATSRMAETGQIFFDEAISEEIMALEPYVSHTEIETLKNSGDGIYAEAIDCESLKNRSMRSVCFADESTAAAMSVADVELMDSVDFTNGVIGYITSAIDTTTIKNGTTASPTGEAISSTSAA